MQNPLTYDQIMQLHAKVGAEQDLGAAKRLIDDADQSGAPWRHLVWLHNRVAYTIGYHINAQMGKNLLALYAKHKQQKEDVPAFSTLCRTLIKGALDHNEHVDEFFTMLCQYPSNTFATHPALAIIKTACYSDHPRAMEWALDHLLGLEVAPKVETSLKILFDLEWNKHARHHSRKDVERVASVLLEVIDDIPHSIDGRKRRSILSVLDHWCQRNRLVMEGFDLLLAAQSWPTNCFPSMQAFRDRRTMLQEVSATPKSNPKVM